MVSLIFLTELIVESIHLETCFSIFQIRSSLTFALSSNILQISLESRCAGVLVMLPSFFGSTLMSGVIVDLSSGVIVVRFAFFPSGVKEKVC